MDPLLVESRRTFGRNTEHNTCLFCPGRFLNIKHLPYLLVVASHCSRVCDQIGGGQLCLLVSIHDFFLSPFLHAFLSPPSLSCSLPPNLSSYPSLPLRPLCGWIKCIGLENLTLQNRIDDWKQLKHNKYNTQSGNKQTDRQGEIKYAFLCVCVFFLFVWFFGGCWPLFNLSSVSVCLSMCQCLCHSVYMSVCLFVNLSLSLSLCLSLSLSRKAMRGKQCQGQSDTATISHRRPLEP